MKEIYERVLKGMKKTRPNDFECLAGLTEEVGEWSLALRVERGFKQRRLDEPSKNEAVDIILLAMEAYIHSGGTLEELPKIINTKLTKWEELFS